MPYRQRTTMNRHLSTASHCKSTVPTATQPGETQHPRRDRAVDLGPIQAPAILGAMSSRLLDIFAPRSTVHRVVMVSVSVLFIVIAIVSIFEGDRFAVGLFLLLGLLMVATGLRRPRPLPSLLRRR